MKHQHSINTHWELEKNLNHYLLCILCSGEDVEKEACFILGLLAIKSEHQHKIAGMTTRLWAMSHCSCNWATQALPVS